MAKHGKGRASSQRRRSSGGGGGILGGLLALVLVAGGGFAAYWFLIREKPGDQAHPNADAASLSSTRTERESRDALDTQRQRQAAQQALAASTAPRQPEVAPVVDTSASSSGPTPAPAQSLGPDPSQIASVQAALEFSRAEYQAMRFAEALAALESVAAMTRLTPQLKTEFDDWHKRVETMRAITGTVKPFRPEYERWYYFTKRAGGAPQGMADPREIKRAGASGRVFIRLSGSGGAWVDMKEVLRHGQLTQEEVDAIYRARLEAKYKSFSARGLPSALSRFHMARMILEYQPVLADLEKRHHEEYRDWRQRAFDLLEQAYEQAKNLKAQVQLESDQDYILYLYESSQGSKKRADEFRKILAQRYPDSGFEEQVQEAAKVEQMTVQEITKVVEVIKEEVKEEVKAFDRADEGESAKVKQAVSSAKRGQTGDLLSLARKFKEEGQGEERLSLPGKPNETEHLKQAIALYMKSQEAYNELLEKNASEELEEEYGEVCKALFWCKKRMPF